VWSRSNWETAHILEGHTASVWAVLALDGNVILTGISLLYGFINTMLTMGVGSADKTIRMWKDGKLVKVLNGHTDCVRGLCRIPGGGFASCGNDAYALTTPCYD